MDILLLDGDLLAAELIDTVLTGAMAGVRVRHVTTVTDAKALWAKQSAQMVLCDWQLSDGPGLELVKFIRATDQLTPIVMMSARTDRDTVIAAARHGIKNFIAKPFDVSMLQRRILPLLETVAANSEPVADEPENLDPPCLDTWLEAALEEKLQLPSDLEPATILPLLLKKDELSAVELTRLWKAEAVLSAKLLNLANSASFTRRGKPIARLDEAITTLGVNTSLSCAMALSLDITASLRDPRLVEQCRLYLTMAEQIATVAWAMASSIALDGLSCYTAGLLSRAGELAVLRAMQNFIVQGGEINDAEIPAMLTKWGPRYGNRLKLQWKLPLPVRELMGAIHIAPTHTTQRTLLIMHLAALKVGSRLNTPEALRMLRQSGLEVEKWLPTEENESLPPDEAEA
ncbi:HDOD domain-containing protein [Oceanisphaera sp.]|uniref:HDOD domain-containing protein n=1 Tax=Oceanisphaera sp. TaxID=1929979 RepID=UPI003A8EEF21